MPDESTNKAISSTNTGFPAYLDFNALRSEAIAYLGDLTGKIWTDYNVHDPGITILETLIYAVLDLGYRTNLPVADLLTRAPGESGSDNNFFTASQILTNNPLTITDYRKLLVDIEGVKNAWLEVDDNTPSNFCISGNRPAGKNIRSVASAAETRPGDPCGCDHLNGLYHVFVELEKDYNLSDEADKNEYDAVLEKIRRALMSRRNLCEDFVDVKVLCRLQIGLCADIELQSDADPSDAYLQILETLRSWFSPQPKFYTLPELLNKGKPIDEIFAGRPYNVKESHGFVDTGEFEAITLRRKLHLSDVYHVLLDIAAVKTVRNLAWRLCGDNSQPQPQITNQWELQLPQNFIPELSPACSGFQFFKNGIRISVDPAKTNSLFNMKFSVAGKILYRQPSPDLDTVIPSGVYHSDLADYPSIQNEFPHVYGIREGDLPLNATAERKAQALQLQGFLLFFDQLLANYLTQLKNIRSLFTLSPPAEKQTYFINQLADVPNADKLFRFGNTGNGDGASGTAGSILAFPTDRKHLESLIASGAIINTDLDRRCNDMDKDDFPPCRFCYAADCEAAENQLRDDFLYGDFRPVVVANYNNCYFFYCFTSSNDFALVSKKYYSTGQEAQTAAASVVYLAAFSENYRSFLTEENGVQYFSFDLELNLGSYAGYLQLICESPALYNTRRQGFLDHLLSRFAESFTDFALLNADLPLPALQTATIRAKETFLTHYDDISSNRGRAFNYLYPGDYGESVSGFEKRFKALCGIETPLDRDQREHLCNFVVEQADEVYTLSITLFGNDFAVENKKVTYEAAKESLESLYQKLAHNAVFDIAFFPAQQQWGVFIKDDFGNKYTGDRMFESENDAEAYRRSLQSTIAGQKAPDTGVFVGNYVYQVQLKNNEGQIVKDSTGKYKTKEEADGYFRDTLPNSDAALHDPAEFSDVSSAQQPGSLLLLNGESDAARLMDKSHFEFKPVDFIQLENVKKKFALLDDKKTFQFDSSEVYDDDIQAEKGFEQLLTLLATRENYTTETDTQQNKIRVVVKDKGMEVAAYFQLFATEEEALQKINDVFVFVNNEIYTLYVSDPIPDSYEFRYHLSDPSGAGVTFTTASFFTTGQEAQTAFDAFSNNTIQLQINKVKNDLRLSLKDDKKIIAHAPLSDERSKEDADMAKQLLRYHRLFSAAIREPEQEIDRNVGSARDTGKAKYIYKLVDKGNYLAISGLSSGDLSTSLMQKNELISRARKGYRFTEIYRGSEVVRERSDAVDQAARYHFTVKCAGIFYQKEPLKGRPLVLFESVSGYKSPEDAREAFDAAYLAIMTKARDAGGYGESGEISLKEVVATDPEGCTTTDSRVFVPSETLYEYDGDTAALVKGLMSIVRNYPIVMTPEKKYSFVLFNAAAQTNDWESSAQYDTPQEAMAKFQFFLSLLFYAGNFYVEKDDKDVLYHIYIREVLAVSSAYFASADDAWGTNGVEKFICVAQTDGGFHHYLNTATGSNSFYVACARTGLVHPCRYDTSERRDAVMNRLFQAAGFNFLDYVQTDEKNNLVLSDINKNAIATILLPSNEKEQPVLCDCLLSFFEAVYVAGNFVSTKNSFYLTDGKKKIAKPASKSISLGEWKKQLQEIACYFPLVREADTSATPTDEPQYKFYIRIKLPGFNDYPDDLTGNCPQVPVENDCRPGCYLAWESDCCFTSCLDALLFYIRSIAALKDISGYKRVYDCNCDGYGIELHPGIMMNESARANTDKSYSALFQLNPAAENSDDKNGRQRVDGDVDSCGSEIIATNPQKYDNAAEACAAAGRAKRLINYKGLHLVEHLLLRPRSKNADGTYDACGCAYLPGPCVTDPNEGDDTCHFRWAPGNDQKTICFTPGCDPYSFIATVALPAWPHEFRSRENRTLLEKMMQTEAPAHVLLHILWLNPRDLCCFEHYFKRWRRWLTGEMKDPEYSNCDFMGLLFHKSFDELGDCRECMPCSDNDPEAASCFGDKTKEPCEDVSLLTQINDLYCWNKNDFQGFPCEEQNAIHRPG